MEELNNYNESIIRLYKQGFSINCISDFLFSKVNKKLKSFNKKSNGEWWVSIPKVSKTECMGHAYNVLYKYIMNKKMEEN